MHTSLRLTLFFSIMLCGTHQAHAASPEKDASLQEKLQKLTEAKNNTKLHYRISQVSGAAVIGGALYAYNQSYISDIATFVIIVGSYASMKLMSRRCTPDKESTTETPVEKS